MTDYAIGGFPARDYWEEQHRRRSSMIYGASLEHLMEIFRLSPDSVSGRRVMDIGVGCGHTARYLLMCGAEVVGCDISQEALDRLPPECERVLSADIASAAPVDIATMGVVIQHCPDKEVERLVAGVPLAPGGELRMQVASAANDVALADHGKILWWRSVAEYEAIIARAGRVVVEVADAGEYPSSSTPGGRVQWHVVFVRDPPASNG